MKWKGNELYIETGVISEETGTCVEKLFGFVAPITVRDDEWYVVVVGEGGVKEIEFTTYFSRKDAVARLESRLYDLAIKRFNEASRGER